MDQLSPTAWQYNKLACAGGVKTQLNKQAASPAVGQLIAVDVVQNHGSTGASPAGAML
jgi:hypothetical protein